MLGKVVNILQEGGDGMFRRATLWLALYSSLSVVFWAMHGPAHNLERILSFQITKNFREAMYRMVTELLMRWYRDHHTGQTVVSSIHRLHLLPLFDRVVVLDGGKIVEEGAFAELVAQGGLLAHLWQQYARETITPSAETSAEGRA